MELDAHTKADAFQYFLTFGWLEISLIILNLILLVFASKIVSLVYPESVNPKLKTNRVRGLRALNVIIIIAITYYHVTAQDRFDSLAFKWVLISLITYFSYLTAHLASFVIRNRYGKKREIEGETKVIETYHSRLLNLFSGIFIFIITLITIIQILEFKSLLEAGGVVGFIGVFFALTQGAWAPDIFSGLIILNSGMVEEGDVIEISEGESSIGIVYKTKMFHTEILNRVNNHRIMIKNAKLREMTIHNLSKFASAKGLRENIHFKIGYDVPTNKIKELFEQAYEQAQTAAEVAIEFQNPLEIAVIETGDHAVEWAIYYYTKDVKNLIKTRQYLRELILERSRDYAIELSTPLTHRVNNDVSGLSEV